MSSNVIYSNRSESEVGEHKDSETNNAKELEMVKMSDESGKE